MSPLNSGLYCFYMNQYIVFYTVETAIKIEAPDLATAETRARILVAQQGPRTKLLCIRPMDQIGPPQDLPNTNRAARLRQGRIKLPKFPKRDS